MTCDYPLWPSSILPIAYLLVLDTTHTPLLSCIILLVYLARLAQLIGAIEIVEDVYTGPFRYLLYKIESSILAISKN